MRKFSRFIAHASRAGNSQEFVCLFGHPHQIWSAPRTVHFLVRVMTQAIVLLLHPVCPGAVIS